MVSVFVLDDFITQLCLVLVRSFTDWQHSCCCFSWGFLLPSSCFFNVLVDFSIVFCTISSLFYLQFSSRVRELKNALCHQRFLDVKMFLRSWSGCGPFGWCDVHCHEFLLAPKVLLANSRSLSLLLFFSVLQWHPHFRSSWYLHVLLYRK